MISGRSGKVILELELEPEAGPGHGEGRA
jgi:hypothetical protein